MASFHYYYSISCSKLYIVAVCCCLALVSLFQFLRIDILTYTEKTNLSSDLVGITDFLHAQYTLLCDLFISHKMKQRLALSELVEASHPSLCLFILKPERKKINPCKAPHTLEVILLYWNKTTFRRVGTPHSLFRSQCSSIQVIIIISIFSNEL